MKNAAWYCTVGLIVAAGILFTDVIKAAVITKQINYEADGVTMHGFLAYDDAINAPRPGVIVVHEWWGQSEFVRNRAQALANLGYVAFALDMYGDGKLADHPKTASEFAGVVKKNLPSAERRFMAAMQVLKQQAGTDREKIAAIGYCLGGGIVLEMARRGVDLDAVVSFHGSLATDNPRAKPGDIKGKVLVFNGENDLSIRPEHIEALKNEMQNANVEFTFKNFSGAKHAFTNPGATELGKKFNIPLEYNEAADKQSWKEMRVFLEEVFK